MNIIGALVALALLCAGYKPKRFGPCIYFVVGKHWGGVNLGMFFLTDSYETEHTKRHEFGHSIQNARYGLLFPFIVAIPSAIRYWVLTYKEKKGQPVPDYDSVWFEGEATKLGYEYIKIWE